MEKKVFRVLVSFDDAIGRRRNRSEDFTEYKYAAAWAVEQREKGRWAMIAELWKDGTTTHCNVLQAWR